MAKWYYWHPDLVREGIVKQGQPPIKQEPEPVPEPLGVELPNYYGKLCEVCGTPLQTRQQKRFCCVDCQKKAYEMAAAERRHALAKAIVRTCKYCGEEYNPSASGHHKYCSDECFRLAQRDYARINKALRRGEIPAKEEPRRCLVCGATLPETLHHAQTTCSEACRHAYKNQYAKERYHQQKEAMNGKAQDDRTV